MILSWLFIKTDAIYNRRKFKFTGKNKFKFFVKFAIGELNEGLFVFRAHLFKEFDAMKDKPISAKIFIFNEDQWERATTVDSWSDK